LKKIFPIIILLVLYSLAYMQESEQALFDQGMAAYRNGNYSEAQNSFFKILQAYPEGNLKTISKLMLGKAYYQLGDYAGVEIVCENFFKNHPNSSYLDDIHHLLGNSFFKRNEYQKAVEEWLWVVHNSKDPRLKKKSGSYVFHTMDQYFSEREIRSFELKYQDNIFDGLVTILRAKKLIEKGEESKGNVLLRKFLREEPNHFYAEEARRLVGEFPLTARTNNFIYFKAVDGELKEIGDKIESGMRYAISEYQTRNQGEQIDIQSVELDQSVASALLTANQKMKNSQRLCLIGPIDADQCAALSLLSKYEQSPYVVPLSSEVGYTQLSPYTFQLTPDVETKGRFIGEYAVQELGLKKVAILAPANDYGKGFARSFMEAIQANGAEVVTDQWYYLFFTEYLAQLEDDENVSSDDSIQAGFRRFMEKKFEDIDYGQDSTQIPATGIDGLLIVTNPQYISYIAPQFAFHNINCMLLGNEGWNDPDQLQKFKQYIDGLTYITSRYYDRDSWNYKEFTTRYRLETKKTPEFYQLFGYDTMKWILQNYRPGITPEELKERLENTNLYQGIIANIQFVDKPRVNEELKVIKFSVGQLVQVN